MICTSCGSVTKHGDQVVRGILAAAGFFLLVPGVAVLSALVLGAETVHENSMFYALAWIALGFPAAGASLRKGFRRACPDCGSVELRAQDSPEGRQAADSGPHDSVLTGHVGHITALAALPDGRLVSGAKDKTVRVWDLSGATAPVVLEGHADKVTAVAAAPDGRVVSAAKDKTVRLWDVSGVAAPIVITGYEHPATALAVLGDGRVVTGDKKGLLRVRDPARPADAGTAQSAGYKSGVKSIEALAALPDGRVAVTGWDGTLRIWDPATGQPPEVRPGPGNVARAPANDVAVLPDGRLAIGESVSTRDATTGRVIVTEADGQFAYMLSVASPIRSLAVLADGRLAAAAYDGLVRIWTVDGAEHPPKVLKAQAQWIAALPDGRLATSGWSKDVHLWEVPAAVA
jgi:WD40 repeat protein